MQVTTPQCLCGAYAALLLRPSFSWCPFNWLCTGCASLLLEAYPDIRWEVNVWTFDARGADVSHIHASVHLGIAEAFQVWQRRIGNTLLPATTNAQP